MILIHNIIVKYKLTKSMKAKKYYKIKNYLAKIKL